MKGSYTLSALPLVSEGALVTTLQNLQHLSYRVKLTGVTCTDKVSGYNNAVVARDFSTVNCGEYIHVSTLNAEVRHYVSFFFLITSLHS